jgi:hypothetical protein
MSIEQWRKRWRKRLPVGSPRHRYHRRIEDIHKIYGAAVDLVGVMNRPQRDARMIKEAGILLEEALDTARERRANVKAAYEIHVASHRCG